MRTATGLILIAVGAIIGLALNVHTRDVNWHILGLIIALTGVAGLLLNPRSNGWLRRRFLVTREPAAQEQAAPGGQGGPAESPYVVDDPAALAAEIINRSHQGDPAPPSGDGPGPSQR